MLDAINLVGIAFLDEFKLVYGCSLVVVQLDRAINRNIAKAVAGVLGIELEFGGEKCYDEH